MDAVPPDAREVVGLVDELLGGTVVRAERLERWRLGWFLDVERRGETLELYVRGARNPDFPSPFDLAHEAAVHDLLESHDFPVPHVHGVVPLGGTEVMVMDRAPGVQGLSAEPDPSVRQRLLIECVGHMARMHDIDLGELEARGFDVPRTADAVVWSAAISRLERHHLGTGGPPDPVLEFFRRWLRRNRPPGRDRPAFVTWDSAQFLHDAGSITALIDFELAHVGDPYMDLAPLRSRDTMEPLGDLAAAFAHYAELTGEPIDWDVLRWFEIAQLTATLMLQRPVLLAPDPDTDLVTHLVWYVESARYACDVVAELLGVELDTVDVGDLDGAARLPSGVATAHRHLVANLHRAARGERGQGDALARWAARCDYRLARHLQRLGEIGPAVTAAELRDASEVVGRSLSGMEDADDALAELVGREDPALDVDLLQYCARRLQRASATLGPPDALLTRHVPMQPLPDAADR